MNKSQIKLTMLVVVLGIVVVVVQSINASKERIYRLNTECTKTGFFFEKEKNEKGLAFWQVLQTTFNNKENSCFAEFSSGPNFVIYNLTNSKDIIYYSVPTIPGDKTNSDFLTKYIIMKEKIFGNEK